MFSHDTDSTGILKKIGYLQTDGASGVGFSSLCAGELGIRNRTLDIIYLGIWLREGRVFVLKKFSGSFGGWL